jgi:hypothetical protein
MNNEKIARKLVDMAQSLTAANKGGRVAKKNYSLSNFHRAAIDTDEAISEAYLKAVSLKQMWDTFEEIPPKQRRMYDDNMKVMNLLRKAGEEAYQTRMTLSKYR